MLIRTRLMNDPFTRLFESMLAPVQGSAQGRPGAGFPPVNLWEDAETIVCEMELPGVQMDDIDLSATGEELTLKGTRRRADRDDAQAIRRERLSGSFERTIMLPAPVAVEKIEASLADGVLTITMPKAESVRARRIEVRGS